MATNNNDEYLAAETAIAPITNSPTREADDALERTQSDAFPEVYKKSTVEQRRKIVSDRIDAICQADPEMRDKIECAFYHSKVSLGLEDGKVPIGKSIFFCLSNIDALNKTYFGRDISSAEAAKILRDHGGMDIFNPLRHDQEYAVQDFKRQLRQTLEDALMNNAPAGYSEIRPAGHGTTPINPDDRAKSIYEAYVLPLFSPSGMRLDADGQWAPSDDNPFKLLAGNVLAAAEKPILNVGTKIADPFVKLFSSETQYNDFRNYVETLGAALDKQRNDSARALGHDSDFQWSNGGNAGDYARQIARAGVFIAPDLLRLAVETRLAGPSGAMVLEGLNAAGETDINLGRQGVDFQKRNTAAAVSALSTMFTFYVMGKAQKFFNPAKRVAGAAGFNSQGFPAIVATDGKEIFARQIGSEAFPEAAGFYKTFFVDLIEKSWLNYAKNVLGETAAVGAASAVSTLAENFANIALGLEKKENLWKGIPEKAVVPMLFAFTSANARYGRAMNAKDFYAGFFRDPKEPYVYRDARASVIKGLLANGGGTPGMTSAVKPSSPISTESGDTAIAKLCGFHSPGFLLDVPTRPFIDYMRYSALVAQSDFPIDFLRLNPEAQKQQLERWKTADGDNGLEQTQTARHGVARRAKTELERTQTDLNGLERTVTDNTDNADATPMMQLDGIGRAQLYFGDRNGKMSHRSRDVFAAAEACKKDFPQLDLGVFNSAQDFPEDVKKEIAAQGFSINAIRAYYRDGKIYVNAEKVRPAEVGRLVIKHELTTHDGIKRVFDAETRKMVFDAIRRDNAQDLQDFCARTGYDVNSDIAVEEYLAERCELEGNDWRKLYAANQEAINAFAENNGTPTGSDEFKRRATYAYFDVHPEELPKVAWYERLFAAFKAAVRKLFSGRIAGFTDVDFRKLFRDMLKAVKEDRPYRQGAEGEGRAATDLSGVNKGKQAYYDIPFGKSVDQVISGQYNGDGSVFLCFTPEIFEQIGFARLPFMTTAVHVKSIYSPKVAPDDHNHNMGESIKDIPEKLKHPLMIITSETHPDTSVVALIDLTQKINGVDRQVVVPVLIGGRSKLNTIDAHIMTSAQGRPNAISKLAKDALDKENNGVPSVLYADKKIEPLLKSAGLQLPNSITFGSATHNINDVGIKVKPQTETLQFKRWFGKSKVVDANGKPLVVYHGARGVFFQFDDKKWGSNLDFGRMGKGFYFTSDKENAENIARNNSTDNGDPVVMSCYLSIQNPKEISWNEISGNNKKEAENLTKKWKSKGYDGFVARTPIGNWRSGGVTWYVAFDPTQIKSATDNVGTFDPNNPDVRFSVEEHTDEELKYLVGAAKDFAGKHYYDVKSDAEFLDFFKKHNLPVESERDAHFIMTLAREEAAAEHRRGAAKVAAKTRKITEKRALDEFADTHPLFAFLQSFVGNDFLINPGERFYGQEYEGDFLSPEFRKYSQEEKIGKRTPAQYRKYREKRENALANASGFNLDEVAQAYASAHGGDPLVIEDEIMALIGNLKKKDIYAAYRERIADEKAEALRLKEDAEKEYVEFLDGEVDRVLESKTEVTKEQLDADKRLARMLYARVFGKKLDGEISLGEIAAINAVIRRGNDSENAGTAAFAEAYLAARDELRAEYREKYKEFREKFLAGNGEMEQKARDLVFSAMPQEMRAKYLAKIIAAGKLPADKREAALDKLIDEITEAGRIGRAKNLVGRFDNRLKQLHLTVDQSRKLVGTRTEEYQKILDEIGKIRSMSVAEVNAEKVRLTEALDDLPDRTEGDGVLDDTFDAEKKLALLEEFGDLESKDPDAIKTALVDLNKYARTGRLKLLDQIAERRAGDQAIRDFVIDRVTSGKGVKTAQAAWDASTAARETPPRVANYAYGLLKLEDFLYLLSTNGEKGDWLENTVGKVFQRVHTSAVEEATSGREFADFRDDLLNRVLGASTSVGRAAKLQKYRERIEHTGIHRFDASTRELTYEEVTLPEAKELRAKYDRGEGVPYNEFQMELLRDKIKAGEMKIERSFRPQEEDKVTETISGAVEKEIQENAKADKIEPTLTIPSVKFKTSYEMQNMTQLEMLDLYLAAQQRDVRYKLFFNGFTEESFKAIDKALLPEMKALGDAMVDFLETQGEKLNEIQKKLFFAGIDQVENYFPMVYESRSVSGAKVAPSLDDPDTAKKAPSRLAPGSLKVRNAHLLEPKVGDALVIFENAVRRTRHYLAFAEVARELRGAFLNPEIKKACDQTFGTGFFKNLRNAIVDTVNGGNANAEYHALYQALYGNAVAGKMMFNLLSGIKQTMSGFAYANEMPVADFAYNVFAVWRHPRETFGALLQSDYLKNRFFGGPDAHAAIVFDGKNQFVTQSHSSWITEKLGVSSAILAATSQSIECLKDWGGIFTRLGDATPCVICGAALYRYHYKRMIDQGFPEAEAKKHALLRWEMATESMQQSAAVHNQNSIQRSTALKPFSAWKSSQTLLGQRFWREIIAGKVFGGRNVVNDKDLVRKNGKSPALYRAYVDQQINSGVLEKITPAGVKRIEKFYRDFPLGKTVETPWGETVVFSPLDVDKTEEYIHHFAVKRTKDANGVDHEEFSESFLELFKKLEESLRNADDRILAVSKDGAPRVCYLKKLGEKNQNHYMVCSVDMDGRIHEWTHMESKDSYIKNQLNREKQAIDQYGLVDKDGLPVNITYQEYLAKKKDIPLYLATAEAHQVLSPQMEASDRSNNINGNPDLSSANEKKNQEYTGAETSGRAATASKAMLVSFVISALIDACGKAWYDFSTRNRKKSQKDEEKNPVADYATECLVSTVSDLVDLDPFAGSAVDLIYGAAMGSTSGTSTDKSMFGDDYLRALQKSYQAGKAIASDEPQKSGEKSVEEKIYDAAASDLQAMGILSPGFQVTGAALKQSKRLWDLWVGGEREAVTPQKAPKSRLYRRRRRKKRFY